MTTNREMPMPLWMYKIRNYLSLRRDIRQMQKQIKRNAAEIVRFWGQL